MKRVFRAIGETIDLYCLDWMVLVLGVLFFPLAMVDGVFSPRLLFIHVLCFYILLSKLAFLLYGLYEKPHIEENEGKPTLEERGYLVD